MDGSDREWVAYLLSIKANRASEVLGFKSPPQAVSVAIHTWLNLEEQHQELVKLLPSLDQWQLRGVTAIPHGRDRARRRRWSTEYRSELVTALERHEIGDIQWDSRARDSDRYLNIDLTNVSRYASNQKANHISLALKGLEQWEAIAEWGSTVYEALKAVYGYVMLDSDLHGHTSRITGFGSNVFDERENAEMSSWSVNQRRMRTLVRDAFVVSYLNPNHVEQLGGVAALQASPVVAEVVEYPQHVRVHLAWQPGEQVVHLNHVIQAFRRTLGPLAIATRRDLAPPCGDDELPVAELRATIRRIQAGGQLPHQRDGAIYRNDFDPRNGSRLLPEKRDPHFYTEYMLSAETPLGQDVGRLRVIVAKNGEWYLSDGHYETAYLLNYIEAFSDLLPDL